MLEGARAEGAHLVGQEAVTLTQIRPATYLGKGKVDEIAGLIGPAARGHDILFSTRILKKTGMRLAGEG